MALAVTITYIDSDGPVTRVGFNLAYSGTYTTGGDTINFTAAAQDPLFVGMLPQIVALGAPISMDVWDTGGGITYFMVPVLGATAANCKMKVASALGTEATGGAAYSSTIKTLVGEAVFNKL